MSVRYTRNALDDLDQISSYLADRNPAAADRFLGAIADVTARLDRFPYSAPQTEMPNIRAATVLRFPYIYAVENGDVIIHCVRHGARRRPWERL
jgi:plasmid stabilization system protein ParE